MAAVNIDRKTFEAWMAEGKTFLVDYWAPWCVYCRRIGPAYDKIAEQYSDSFPAVKIDIDLEEELSRLEQIEIVPTLVLYRDGKAIGSIVAPESKAMIDAFIQENLG